MWDTKCEICDAKLEWKLSGRGKAYGGHCKTHGFVALKANPIMRQVKPRKLTLWQTIKNQLGYKI